jgi:hypothetical protein
VMEESFNDSILVPHKDHQAPLTFKKGDDAADKSKKKKGLPLRKASVETLDLPSPTGSMSPLEGSMKRSFKRRQSSDAGDAKHFSDI